MSQETLEQKKARRARERQAKQNDVTAQQDAPVQNEQVVNTETNQTNDFCVSFKVSGGEITFKSKWIPHAKIEERTRVNSVTNNRPQALLTELSLKPLVAGLKRRKQLHPAYAFKMSDGLYEVIDGSRRRKGCIQAELDFWVLVCDPAEYEFDITVDDMVDIRRDLQTGKEESSYEFGLECIELEKQLGSQKAVADRFECSTAKVSRAMKAARVSVDLLSLFDDYSVLSHSDITALVQLQDEAEKLGMNPKELADSLDIAVAEDEDGDYDEVVQAKMITKNIKSFVGDKKKQASPKSGDSTTTHDYLKNSDQVSYRLQRKSVIRGKHRNEVFETRDAPKELVNALDQLMQAYAKGPDEFKKLWKN